MAGRSGELEAPPAPQAWQLECLRSRKAGEDLDALAERLAGLPATTSSSDDGAHRSLLSAFRALSTGNRQSAAGDAAGAVETYGCALSDAAVGLHRAAQTSRELGRIRLGCIPGMEAPTVEIHKHLTAAALCGRAAAHLQLGSAWRALADAEAATEAFVEWGSPHARAGAALEAAGADAAALRCYRRAAAFSPGISEYSNQLAALLRRVVTDGGSEAALAAPNPEARWVAQGGGPPRLWLPLRAAAAAAALDLGEALFRGAGEAIGGGLAAQSASADCGAFYAEQQQLLEHAVGVCAHNAGFATLLGVLDASLDPPRQPPVRRAFAYLALANLLAWAGDPEGGAAAASRGIQIVEAPPFAAAMAGFARQGCRPEDWLATLLCNRALCRLRAGGAGAVESAREDATAALRLRPEAPRPHGRAGDCAAEAGAWAQAAAHYAMALRLAPPGGALAQELESRLALARCNGRCRTEEEEGHASPSGLARNASTASLDGLLPGSPLDCTGAITPPDLDGPEAAVQAALAAYARSRKGRRREEPSAGAQKSPKRSHGATPEGTPPRGSSPYAGHGEGGSRHSLPSHPPAGFDFSDALWGSGGGLGGTEELLEADALLSESAYA